METVNVHHAKTHLSRLIERAAKGESFVIARAGKPMVRVVPLNAPDPNQIKRVGFMSGQFSIPADFDRPGDEIIDELFSGKP